MALRVCVDAGHGQGVNPGAVPGYFEGNSMFVLAELLKSALEKYEGVEVVLSRAALEDNPKIETRGAFAGQQGCTLMLSLHSDAFTSPDAGGVTVFRSLRRPGSEVLRRALGEAIAKTMGTSLRKTSTRLIEGTVNLDWYGIIRSAVKHECVEYAFLLEHGFHTNERECAWLMSPGNLARLAQAEAEVVAAHFGLGLKADGAARVSELEAEVQRLREAVTAYEVERNSVVNLVERMREVLGVAK